MIRRTAIATALALTVGGCSSHRHTAANSSAQQHTVRRVEVHDSIRYITAAYIDSPEIILESPALPGGRATIRGKRLTAATSADISSHSHTTDTAHTVISTSATSTHESRPSAPGTGWLSRIACILAIFVICVLLIRKFL